jgi:hypothetical protein
MAYKICPACGSRYFLTQRGGGNRQVFAVGDNSEMLQVADSRATEHLEVNPQCICCGACSWRGALDDLLFSDL